MPRSWEGAHTLWLRGESSCPCWCLIASGRTQYSDLGPVGSDLCEEGTVVPDSVVFDLFVRHCAVSILAGKRVRHKKQIPNEKVLTDGDPRK